MLPVLPAPLRRPGLFITATDTGVGKTVVSCSIAYSLRRAGLRVGVCKPMATGCRTEREGLVNEDAEALAHFSDCRQPLDVINPLRFKSPVAPGVAAAEAGLPMDYAAIGRSLVQLDQTNDGLVIEGAGGLLVPIDPVNADLTMLDLMQALGYPVVVVARALLGTLNHTAMTVKLLRQAGLQVAGIVINGYEADVAQQEDASMATNRDWLRAMNRLPILATVPRCAPEEVQPHKGVISPAVLEAVALQDWRDVIQSPRPIHR